MRVPEGKHFRDIKARHDPSAETAAYRDGHLSHAGERVSATPPGGLRRGAGVALLVLGLLGPAMFEALADPTEALVLAEDGPVMTAAEVQTELFGVEVVGEDDGRPWRECISPEGKSILHKDNMVYHGTVYVSSAGYQCFIYEEQPGARWCWRMFRTGKDQFINELPQSGARQTMRIVRKKVKECSGEALVG